MGNGYMAYQEWCTAHQRVVYMLHQIGAVHTPKRGLRIFMDGQYSTLGEVYDLSEVDICCHQLVDICCCQRLCQEQYIPQREVYVSSGRGIQHIRRGV